VQRRRAKPALSRSNHAGPATERRVAWSRTSGRRPPAPRHGPTAPRFQARRRRRPSIQIRGDVAGSAGLTRRRLPAPLQPADRSSRYPASSEVKTAARITVARRGLYDCLMSRVWRVITPCCTTSWIASGAWAKPSRPLDRYTRLRAERVPAQQGPRASRLPQAGARRG